MKKVLSIIMVAMMLLTILVVCVNAQGENCKIAITSDKASVTAGELVTFTFSVKELNIGDTQGIFAIGGKITYDKTVFDSIVSVEGQNGFEVSGGTITEDGKLAVNRKSSYLTQDADIFKVTLKAKSVVAKGETEIKFSNVTGNTSDTATLPISDTTFVLRTGEGNTTVPTQVVAPTTGQILSPTSSTGTISINTPTQAQTVSPTNSIIKTTPVPTTNVQNSSTNTKMPKSGVDDTIIPIIIVAVLMVIVTFVRYVKLK